MRCEIMVGTISTSTMARINQREPAKTREDGKAANKPPIATTAIAAGQRGSPFVFGETCMFD